MNPKAGVWVWYLRGELTVTNTRHFGFSYGRVFEKKKIPAVHLHSFIVSWIRNYTLSRTNTHSHRLTGCRLTAVIRDRTTCLAKYFPSLMKKLRVFPGIRQGFIYFPQSVCAQWSETHCRPVTLLWRFSMYTVINSTCRLQWFSLD